MKVGIWCLGWGGDTSRPDWVIEAAQTAEKCGFSTMWAGEHFLYFDHAKSQYPYAEPGSASGAALGTGGKNALTVTTDLLDPFISLTWAGAVTSTIRLGTGIALLPLRNPVVLAKQVATLDHLTRGRFLLGAGLGWMEEEYDAIGIPMARRVTRMEEYVESMRCLWHNESSTFLGEFTSFEQARCYPKPANGSVPVYFGGMADAVLRRVARMGDGWLAVSLPSEDAEDRVSFLRKAAEECGRDPDSIEIAASLPRRETFDLDDFKRYRDAGVDEISVRVGGFHFPDGPRACVEDLARRVLDPVLSLTN